MFQLTLNKEKAQSNTKQPEALQQKVHFKRLRAFQFNPYVETHPLGGKRPAH